MTVDLATVSDAELLAEVERRRAKRIARELIQLGAVGRAAVTDPGSGWIGPRQAPPGVWPAVRRAIREGELSGSRVGRQLLVRRADLDAWIEGQRPAVKPAGLADPVEQAIAAGRLRRVGGRR